MYCPNRQVAVNCLPCGPWCRHSLIADRLRTALARIWSVVLSHTTGGAPPVMSCPVPHPSTPDAAALARAWEPDRLDVHNSIVHNLLMDTIYDLSATSNHSEQIDFSAFCGRPMLIVNTASKCGFTPQYDGLQALHERYGPQGLIVIGFPCNQFAHQEPGDDAQIEEFCRATFGITFPLTTKVDVNGKGTHPVFAFLKERTGGRLGTAVKWNFTKFLVAPDGTSVKRYAPNTEPAKLAGDIELLLADAAA
jgi:glutathione peroxidase